MGRGQRNNSASAVWSYQRAVLGTLIAAVCLCLSLQGVGASEDGGIEGDHGVFRRLQAAVPRAMTLEERKGIDRGGNTVGTDVEGQMVSKILHLRSPFLLYHLISYHN